MRSEEIDFHGVFLIKIRKDGTILLLELKGYGFPDSRLNDKGEK